MKNGSKSNQSVDLSFMVSRHFRKVRTSFFPISIRTHVDDVKRQIGSDGISDDDLVRTVERFAIEFGFPVCFDGRMSAPRPTTNLR